MNEIPRISEAEWEVLGVLWKEEPLSSTQIAARLGDRAWKASTVRTFLARLEKKGVIRSEDLAGSKMYFPAVTRDACVRQESASFLNRVFEGATAALLVHFARSQSLKPEEVAELEAILAQGKKKKK